MTQHRRHLQPCHTPTAFYRSAWRPALRRSDFSGKVDYEANLVKQYKRFYTSFLELTNHPYTIDDPGMSPCTKVCTSNTERTAQYPSRCYLVARVPRTRGAPRENTKMLSNRGGQNAAAKMPHGVSTADDSGQSRPRTTLLTLYYIRINICQLFNYLKLMT